MANTAKKLKWLSLSLLLCVAFLVVLVIQKPYFLYSKILGSDSPVLILFTHSWFHDLETEQQEQLIPVLLKNITKPDETIFLVSLDLLGSSGELAYKHLPSIISTCTTRPGYGAATSRTQEHLLTTCTSICYSKEEIHPELVKLLEDPSLKIRGYFPANLEGLGWIYNRVPPTNWKKPNLKGYWMALLDSVEGTNLLRCISSLSRIGNPLPEEVSEKMNLKLETFMHSKSALSTEEVLFVKSIQSKAKSNTLKNTADLLLAKQGKAD